MRLTDEKIADVKEYLNRSIKVTVSSLIPQLSKYGLDLIDTIEALQQENEQLRAQVAKLQEVLRGIEKEYVNDFTDEELDEGLCSRDNAILNYWVRPVLNYGTVDYHNPADAEALRNARNLLQRYKDHIKSYPCECKFGLDFYGNKTPFRDGEMCERCAELAEIDKAIGGKEDVTSMGD